MRIGSLCSGAGGLDMAAEQVFGAITAWHCEIDSAASRVLAHRYPGVPNHGDFTNTDLRRIAEPVDILTGGYPCQPFSHAGQRKGTHDERHIWPWVRHAIRRVRPRYTFLENVAGHRSLGFDRVLGDLAEDGMHVRWTSVRASDIGACHQRERVFLLITPADADDSASDRQWSRPELRRRGQDDAGLTLLPTPAASRSGRNQSLSPGAAVRPSLDSITDLLPTPSAADGGGGHLTRSGDRSTELLLPGVARAYGNGELLPTPTSRDHKGHNPNRDGGNDLPGALALLPTPAASDSHRGPDLARANRPGSGGDDLHTFVYKVERDDQWGKYGPAIQRWETITRVAPSPTEPNTKGNPRLNPAFPEWMQGWPAGWVTAVPGISRNDQLRIIGNGVVPQAAAYALRWLLRLEMAA